MKEVKVGSRGSRLALAQTRSVIDRLEPLYPDIAFTVKIINTAGDKLQDISINRAGDKGMFVGEIEQAMLDMRIDMAVHSMKDVPPQLLDGLCIAAMPPREDPRDAFVSADGRRLEQLQKGARIGTGSARRATQLKSHFPDIEMTPIRGNVDTRLNKMYDMGLEGIVLAVAGLKRLGLEDRITELIPTDICMPAAGQGAIGIEIRQSDGELAGMLAAINHEPTWLVVCAERLVTEGMGGNCSAPIGVYGEINGSDMVLRAALEEDGRVARHSAEGLAEQYERLAFRLVRLFAGEI